MQPSPIQKIVGSSVIESKFIEICSYLTNRLRWSPSQGGDTGSNPVRSTSYGLACTKAGDVPLQGTCGEFDSLRVHSGIVQRLSMGGFDPPDIGSNPVTATMLS